MELIHTVERMKQVARQARTRGEAPGLVPTMGALHDGHLALVRAAMAACRPVIVSIFVNPAQFGPHEDFQKYPRTLDADCKRLEQERVDYLFLPEARDIYPPQFRTWVNVEGLSERLEGGIRPGHFRGVATVVLKLIEITQPQKLFLGRKDAQQARLIEQMACDLNLDADIVVCPIERETDGLAWSSRNLYLHPAERRAATVLYRALDAARVAIDGGNRDVAGILATMRGVLAGEPLAHADYVELVDSERLQPVSTLRGTCMALLAVRIGATRLIDNLMIEERGGGIHTTL